MLGERFGFLFFTHNVNDIIRNEKTCISLLFKEMPICVIGQHILDGKIVELEKPLLVMRKRQENNTSYQVECVIKRKLLFHKRSKPIIQHSLKKF